MLARRRHLHARLSAHASRIRPPCERRDPAQPVKTAAAVVCGGGQAFVSGGGRDLVAQPIPPCRADHPSRRRHRQDTPRRSFFPRRERAVEPTGVGRQMRVKLAAAECTATGTTKPEIVNAILDAAQTDPPSRIWRTWNSDLEAGSDPASHRTRVVVSARHPLRRGRVRLGQSPRFSTGPWIRRRC
jgi:hypothetical protein